MPFPRVRPEDLSSKDILMLLMDINNKVDNTNKRLDKVEETISNLKTYVIAKRYLK
jgi:hypothetical protein